MWQAVAILINSFKINSFNLNTLKSVCFNSLTSVKYLVVFLFFFRCYSEHFSAPRRPSPTFYTLNNVCFSSFSWGFLRRKLGHCLPLRFILLLYLQGLLLHLSSASCILIRTVFFLFCYTSRFLPAIILITFKLSV